jgi:uncharacterized protein (TIGR00369 family)
MSEIQKTNPLSQEAREKIQKSWNSNIILTSMGIQVDFSDDNVIRAFIDPVQPHHRGGLGTAAVNGAVLSALFDLIIGLVGMVNSNNHRTGTVQLNMNFLRAVNGDKLSVEGRLVKLGKSLVFARGEIFDENNRLCSTCDGICSIDTGKPPVESFMSI